MKNFKVIARTPDGKAHVFNVTDCEDHEEAQQVVRDHLGEVKLVFSMEVE